MTNDLEISACEEAKLKEYLSKTYNCGTCKFLYFNYKDTTETERCGIAGRFKKVPRNRKLEELIFKYDIKSICSAWQHKGAK